VPGSTARWLGQCIPSPLPSQSTPSRRISRPQGLEDCIDADALTLTRAAEASEREILERMAGQPDWLLREFGEDLEARLAD
jgi:hypothetical protein